MLSFHDALALKGRPIMTPAGSLLIVDDEEMNRDMLARRLEHKGYSVATADNGTKALAMVERHSFDLILLDVMMPDLNGLEVLGLLRRLHSPAELPVIMVTARDQSCDVVEALTLGSNDYVTKPIDFPVVLARIATQVAQKRVHAALRESEARYALAALGTSNGLWHWDLVSGTAYFAGRWQAMLGYEEGEIGNSPEEWLGRVHPDDVERVRAYIADHCRHGTAHFECEHRLAHKDQTYIWVLARGVAVRDKRGKGLRIAGSLTDITLGKVSDPLTGLPNRIYVMDRLERFIERARRDPRARFAVLFLDLDHFKVVNDRLGHVMGDRLLIAFARRLEACLRKTDTLTRTSFENTPARLAGDEFTILVDGIDDIRDAIAVAERVQHALTLPFYLGEHEILTSASIGIASNGPDTIVPEDLLRDADAAMYGAKSQGKARYAVFDTAMSAGRQKLDSNSRRAARLGESRLHYQPAVL